MLETHVGHVGENEALVAFVSVEAIRRPWTRGSGTNIARTTVTALAEPEGQDAMKAADAKHVRAAATRSAWVWIRLIQAQIHDRMGEESAGTGALSEAIESLELKAQVALR